MPLGIAFVSDGSRVICSNKDRFLGMTNLSEVLFWIATVLSQFFFILLLVLFEKVCGPCVTSCLVLIWF